MTRKAKTSAFRNHEEATIESFRKDPKFAAEYLNDVLEDGDQEEVMIALRRMAHAFGGVPKLAERAKLNATTLYRTLSREGNPELRSMAALLKAMGLRLAVQPIRISARKHRSPYT
jgi:probable addiction module antidote protein